MGVFLRGLRFGMMLQLSVGPVCLFVLQVASAHGFSQGMAAVAGVVAVDALYVSLAVMGTGALLRRKRVRKVVLVVGASTLFLFGLDDILTAFGIPFLPSLDLADGVAGAGPFLYAVLLTASNPLTILFWGGVFASEAEMAEGRLPLFGVGCVCATAIFMTVASAIGSLAGNVIGMGSLEWLDAVVGIALVVFGVRLLYTSSASAA